MSTCDVMHCRHCEKYIGFKTALEDYFFWCDEKCHDANQQEILERNQGTLIASKSTFKDKPKAFCMTGSLDPDGNIIDKVINSSSSATTEKVKKPRKKREEKVKKD